MSRAPRVLVSGVVLAQPMGGVRRHNTELLPRAARLLSEGGGALAVLEGTEPIPFELPGNVERLPSKVPPRPAPIRAAKEGRALNRALAEARAAGRSFDLVHTAHLPAPRALSVPRTLTLHDLRGLYLEHTPFSRRFFARTVIGGAVRGAARVFTVSETVAEQLRAGFGLAPARMGVVANAGDHFTPLPRAADPSTGGPILHLGHLEPRKNLERLVHALAAAPDLPPVLFAGRPKHGEEERLAALARELVVEGRVRFHGPYAEEELPSLLAGAGCVALPSHLEGFGIVALEAQLALAPLAISDTPALVEVAGEDVPRFAPGDTAGCVRALRAALKEESPILAERAARASRFTWDASAAALVEGWSRAVAEAAR